MTLQEIIAKIEELFVARDKEIVRLYLDEDVGMGTIAEKAGMQRSSIARILSRLSVRMIAKTQGRPVGSKDKDARRRRPR